MTFIGKYEILEELGRGSYGTVYRARDTVLEVVRAVKVLHPALVADHAFIERFSREAKYAARLKHPHIVPVYDLGESEGRFYLAMEYMPGGSLKDLITKQGRLPFKRAVKIMGEIAGALDHIHEQGLIHRDVKPGNILFDERGNSAITDLGFAKALLGGDTASLSASGGIIGTPSYIAPEVWRGEAVTPATDIYSLACVFFEMLTGQVLFKGDSPPEVMTKHVLDGPQFPPVWPEGIPTEVEGALRKSLAIKPEDRYVNMTVFACDLESLLPGQESTAQTVPSSFAAHPTEIVLDIKPIEDKRAVIPPQVALSSTSTNPDPIKKKQTKIPINPGKTRHAIELSVYRKTLIWVARGWATGWSIGMAIGWAIFFWLIRSNSPINLLNLGFCGVIGGAVGGPVSGLNLRVSFRLDQRLFLWITMGWAIAWAISWSIIGAIFLAILEASTTFFPGLFLGGILGGALGCGIMIWQLKSAEK
jgi:serine/threonine protein kinase